MLELWCSLHSLQTQTLRTEAIAACPSDPQAAWIHMFSSSRWNQAEKESDFIWPEMSVASGWLLHPISSPSWPNKPKYPTPFGGLSGIPSLLKLLGSVTPSMPQRQTHLAWIPAQPFNWVISAIKTQENGWWGFWWDWGPGSWHTEWTQW